MNTRSQSAPHKHLLRLIVVITSLLTLALTIASTAQAQPPSPLLPATDSSRQIASLFWITLAIAGVVFVIVEALLIYFQVGAPPAPPAPVGPMPPAPPSGATPPVPLGATPPMPPSA